MTFCPDDQIGVIESANTLRQGVRRNCDCWNSETAILQANSCDQIKPAPKGAGDRSVRIRNAQELAFSTVTARRFCDQQEMSLQTATGRSLP